MRIFEVKTPLSNTRQRIHKPERVDLLSSDSNKREKKKKKKQEKKPTATFNRKQNSSRSFVNIEVDVLGSPSLTVLAVSVDEKRH